MTDKPLDRIQFEGHEYVLKAHYDALVKSHDTNVALMKEFQDLMGQAAKKLEIATEALKFYKKERDLFQEDGGKYKTYGATAKEALQKIEGRE